MPLEARDSNILDIALSDRRHRLVEAAIDAGDLLLRLVVGAGLPIPERDHNRTLGAVDTRALDCLSQYARPGREAQRARILRHIHVQRLDDPRDELGLLAALAPELADRGALGRARAQVGALGPAAPGDGEGARLLVGRQLLRRGYRPGLRAAV